MLPLPLVLRSRLLRLRLRLRLRFLLLRSRLLVAIFSSVVSFSTLTSPVPTNHFLMRLINELLAAGVLDFGAALGAGVAAEIPLTSATGAVGLFSVVKLLAGSFSVGISTIL